MTRILHHLNYYLVAISFLVLIFYLLDPYPNSWGSDNYALLKYLPVFLINISLVFNLFFYFLKLNKTTFSIGLFLVFMLAGSSYTVFISHNSLADSFMGRALIGLTFINFISLLQIKRYALYFRDFFLYAFALLSLWFFCLLVLQQSFSIFDVKHIFHEEIILTTSSSILFFSYFKSNLLKFTFTFIAILTGFLSFKLTGFICSFLAIFILNLMWWHANGKQKLNRRVFIILNYILLILLGASLVYFLYDYLPSGSPSVRVVTYLQRLNMFLTDPIFGTFFIGTPILEHAWLNIPSHSDLLDILAFGGVCSMFLFLFYPLKIILFIYQKFSFLVDKKKYFLFFNFLIVISFLCVSFVNPVMNQPKIGIFFWFSLAYLIINYRSK